MQKKDFDEFFEPYSQNVDNANKLGFWKLSDELIMRIITENIPSSLNSTNILLDAGGGTGRWIAKLSKTFSCKFVLYDLSGAMLKQAKKNIAAAAISDRVALIEGNLTDMHTVPSNSIDHVVSIYSPISFVYNKRQAMKELFRVLKPGGKLIIMGHGFHNALASKINNYNAPAVELKALNTKKMVKWGAHVPELNVFSREIFESDLRSVGFIVVKTYGVPIFAQPGSEDFDPNNAKLSRISAALENEDFFEAILELEMQYNSDPAVVNRGMNIFTVAMKN
jgi:ubiquinone/menaquinone biosynthesis C-methylase UbiE